MGRRCMDRKTLNRKVCSGPIRSRVGTWLLWIEGLMKMKYASSAYSSTCIMNFLLTGYKLQLPPAIFVRIWKAYATFTTMWQWLVLLNPISVVLLSDIPRTQRCTRRASTNLGTGYRIVRNWDNTFRPKAPAITVFSVWIVITYVPSTLCMTDRRPWSLYPAVRCRDPRSKTMLRFI